MSLCSKFLNSKLIATTGLLQLFFTAAIANAQMPEITANQSGALCKAVAEQYAKVEQRIPHPMIVRGNRNKRQIALTFDDGPHPGKTERLLEILHHENVKATFFTVGTMVERSPGLVRMISSEGHELANHTYSHRRLPTLSQSEVEKEIRLGAAALQAVTGVAPRLYRPPGGEYDNRITKIGRTLGQVMVLWTDDPADFALPGSQKILHRTLSKTSNGSIILLHDGIDQTMEILPELIHTLRARGYTFVTCSELAQDPQAVHTGGPHVKPNDLPLEYLKIYGQ